MTIVSYPMYCWCQLRSWFMKKMYGWFPELISEIKMAKYIVKQSTTNKIKSCYYEIIRLLISMIMRIGRFRWHVEIQEGKKGMTRNPAFRIFGVTFLYYKWSDSAIIAIGPNSDIETRIAEKNELEFYKLKEKE